LGLSQGETRNGRIVCLSFDVSKLSGEERRQYFILEDLFSYSFGKTCDEGKLCEGLRLTIEDWKKKMGGKDSLELQVLPYIERVSARDGDAAKNLYFFISPIFFHIHVLKELSRSEWRNATSWNGMFCERIVKNLLRAFDRAYDTHGYEEVETNSLDHKLGKLRSELESKHFGLTNELCNLVEIIYSLRDTRGPHDVPPPEPLRAKISATHSLPVYSDYLEALIFLKNDLLKDQPAFVSFFSDLIETKIKLSFGEEGRMATVDYLLKNALYREGFFGAEYGRKLSDVQMKLNSMRHNFTDQAVAAALFKASKGKEAFLTRKGKRKNYTYHERGPPKDYFEATI
jgi:hypothetical protein